MDVVSLSGPLPPHCRGAVVAIGNFDGVHRGHQALIGRARTVAAELDVPAGVMTFEPHPRSFFQPLSPPFRLTPLPAKIRVLDRIGIDVLYVAAFDAALAARHAADFVIDLIVERMGAVHVVIGPDFHFGRGRSGGPATMRHLGEAEGFGVTVVDQLCQDSHPISSTAIRAALAEGDMAGAAALLGRPWSILGTVETGDRRGRTIGFPTANIAMGDYFVPALGVYAVEVALPDGRTCPGVANLGRRPTFDKAEVNLEVHLLDFAGDLYGQVLDVALVAHLRGERKFPGLDALKAQIAQDRDRARAILNPA